MAHVGDDVVADEHGQHEDRAVAEERRRRERDRERDEHGREREADAAASRAGRGPSGSASSAAVGVLGRGTGAGAADTATGGGGHSSSPVVGDGHAALHRVVEVEHQRAVLARCEQLRAGGRRWCRTAATCAAAAGRPGRSSRRSSRRSAVTTRWPGTVSSQLPPPDAARSTMTEPGRIAATMSAVIVVGAVPAHQRGGDDDVRLGRLGAYICGGRRLLLVGQRAAYPSVLTCCCAAAARTNAAPIDSICSPTSGRTSNARTCAPRRVRRADRREPGHARADDEHPRRRRLARRRDLAAEHPAVLPRRPRSRRGSRRRWTACSARPGSAPARCAARRRARAR